MPLELSPIRRLPDTAVHTYNALVAMPGPASLAIRVLGALHDAAGQERPPQAIWAAMIARGPVRALKDLRAIDGFGRRRQSRLRAALTHDNASLTIAATLEAFTRQKYVVPERPPLPHPFGEHAPFPPLVARALGQEGGLVYGTPRVLPGFAYNSKIVHFRDAVLQPVPASAIVLGAGYIGSEMALGWANAGATVTLVDRCALLAGFPPDRVENVRSMLTAAGVHIRIGVFAQSWKHLGNQIVIAATIDGRPALMTAEKMLVAVGVLYRPPKP